MDDSQQPSPSSQSSESDPDEELTRLRERLAFYESFDQLIQDNVSRAGNLLREAATRHQDGELAIRGATAEFEQKQLAERIGYRQIFSALLDDVTTVQQNVERLAGQIADALDDLESIIPAAGEAALDSEALPSLPTFRPQTAGELGPGSSGISAEWSEASASVGTTNAHDGLPFEADIELDTVEHEVALETDQSGYDEVVHHGFSGPAEGRPAEPVDELLPEDDSGGDHETLVTEHAASPGSSALSHIVQSSVERISQAIGGRNSAGSNEIGLDEAAEPEGITVDLAPTAADVDDDLDDNADWADGGEPAATTLLVHGVPRATTALSLKRYLEGLDQVHSVEPREYAEGVLRLQVSSERPVRLDDLRGWPEASALEPLAIRDDFMEVRLGQ